MCSPTVAFCIRCYRSQADASWYGVRCAIDEQDRFRRGNLRREIGCPLLACNHTNVRVLPEPLSGPLGKTWPDPIVAAQRVATSKNKATGCVFHRLIVFRIRPEFHRAVKTSFGELKIPRVLCLGWSARKSNACHKAILLGQPKPLLALRPGQSRQESDPSTRHEPWPISSA